MPIQTIAKDGCHAAGKAPAGGAAGILLIGHANVGKSALFGQLTGRYAFVSNYPGTTVDITQGPCLGLPGLVLFDSPGLASLPTRAEDEQIALRLALEPTTELLVQVGDAKNLRRTLHLTLQLATLGLPQVLILNMADEAAARGLPLPAAQLEQKLGLPVLPMVATQPGASAPLLGLLQDRGYLSAPALNASSLVPAALMPLLEAMIPRLPATNLSNSGLALLWLSGDPVVESHLVQRLPEGDLAELRQLRESAHDAIGESIHELLYRHREELVNNLVTHQRGFAECQHHTVADPRKLVKLLESATTHPVTAWPVLALVLAAVYWFVGQFGAGTLVGLLEERLFGEVLNPWMIQWVEHVSPWAWLTSLLCGEYGLWTMGVTYAFALLLPIVSTFFVAFSVLEDSGYLPRLAVLSNQAFTRIGLNGKAVLPMVLGLGCVTLATLTTRTLESRRDRMLVTLLLGLAVPCSAQLGVTLGMLASISLAATLIWASILLLVLFAVGALAARLLPGERTPLLVELPPLRRPRMRNVLLKTWVRLEWYFKEAFPLFLLGTMVVWTLDTFGALPWVLRVCEPVTVQWLQLPPEATTAFLLGFLRRDFAATGLFTLEAGGLLTAPQVLVAMVTITLFLPCIATVFVIARERGARVATGMVVLIFPLAVLIGGVLSRLLHLVGWSG